MEKINESSEGNGAKEITLDQKMVQLVIEDPAVFSLEGFQENDKKVLSILNQEKDLTNNQYTFNGLARKLGMHQQSLSRSLRRLETSGLVEKKGSGYVLCKSLSSMLVKKSRLDLEDLSRRIFGQTTQFMPILHLYIPDEIGVADLVKSLVGRWFGNLRWLGLAEGDESSLLQWSCGEKFQVNLKISSRYATVESNATGEGERGEALVSSCKIFEQMIKIFQSKPVGRTGAASFNHYNYHYRV